MNDGKKVYDGELFDQSKNLETDSDGQDAKELSKEYRKALMTYGQGKNSLIFVLLHLVPVLLIWISIGLILVSNLTVSQNGELYNIGYIKPIMIIIGILVSIMPIGLLLIYLGSFKYDINKVLKGLKIIHIYLKITYWIIIFSAIIFGMVVLIILFRIFALALILGIFGGALIGFYIMFIRLQIDFVENCTSFLKLSDPKFKRKPRPLKFKIYLIILLVIAVGSLVLNGVSFDVDTPFIHDSTVSAFRATNIILFISSVFQIAKLSFGLYLIQDFNRYLYKIK